jgi:hypothetical protein
MFVVLTLVVIFIILFMVMYVMEYPIFSSLKETFNNTDFYPSKTFTGSKPGYVFMSGEKGQGYYKDKHK